jgi:bifunctional ADP-heptose synthase (sugar kinase/adenylyltransferase)
MKFQGVYLFKPNLKELREGLKTEVNPLSDSDMERVTDELFAALGIENILITLSEHGIYYRNQATMGRIPAERRHIADVSGAGDTVIAIESLALHCGANLAEAAALANLGGGMVCETPGVVPIDVHQLLKESLKLRQK